MVDIRKKKVLVTGGAGFIGSHLAERLSKISSHVLVLDNLQAGRTENLKSILNQVEFIKGDIRDTNLVKQSVKKVEIIFHIAANASVPNSVKDPRYDFETNAGGTFNLIEAAVSSNIERFVYASTAAVYGNPVYTPIDEKHPLNPISPYGASKLSAERIGFAFREIFNLSFAAIRIFNTYGPRQPRYVIYDFLKKLKEDPGKLEVLGDGNQVRDYCYISDMVEAFLLVAEKGEGIYNAAGGHPITIRELAELMVSRVSPSAKISYGGKTWPGDIKVLVADISRLGQLGFKPEVNVKDGNWLENMLHYF